MTRQVDAGSVEVGLPVAAPASVRDAVTVGEKHAARSRSTPTQSHRVAANAGVVVLLLPATRMRPTGPNRRGILATGRSYGSCARADERTGAANPAGAARAVWAPARLPTITAPALFIGSVSAVDHVTSDAPPARGPDRTAPVRRSKVPKCTADDRVTFSPRRTGATAGCRCRPDRRSLLARVLVVVGVARRLASALSAHDLSSAR